MATLSLVRGDALFNDGYLSDYLDQVRVRGVEIAGGLPEALSHLATRLDR